MRTCTAWNPSYYGSELWSTLPVAYIWERAMVRPPPPWSDRKFFDNFWTVFVSFDSRLNCKMRVPRLLVTVRVFCLLQTTAKCTQTYHFGDKNYFLGGRGPAPSTTPNSRRRLRARRPLLTEILNTPLHTAYTYAYTNWEYTVKFLVRVVAEFNPLRTHCNRRATDHNTTIRWLVHWPLMGGLIHFGTARRGLGGCVLMTGFGLQSLVSVLRCLSSDTDSFSKPRIDVKVTCVTCYWQTSFEVKGRYHWLTVRRPINVTNGRLN